MGSMTPDDMEGRLERLQADLIGQRALAYEQVYEDGDLIKDADAILAALGPLETDAAQLEAMGQDPDPTLQDIFIDTPGWFEDDYEPSN